MCAPYSAFQFLRPSLAPVVNYTCDNGVGCSLPLESSFASGMQHDDMLVPSSGIAHQCMYHTVACILSYVILVSQDIFTYSFSEVELQHASGSTFQHLPHVPPAPIVNHICKIDGGCSFPLESTSIHSHLRDHHRYLHKDSDRVSCPWQGCSKKMRWVNVPRHIRVIHLGDRLPCRKCGKLYSRKDALDVHTTKCN